MRPWFTTWTTWLVVLISLAGGFCAQAEAIADRNPDETDLEANGAVIRRILINPQPIFDESLPGERTYLFRLANSLHVDTRAEVIEAQLLFKTGDRFSTRVLRETERNLRKLRFLREPEIRVVAAEGNQVDLEVRTIDVWTLTPTLAFGRSGGSNRSSVGIEDFNFLGLGKMLEVSRRSDRDRSENVLTYRDPNLGYSRWTLDLELSDNSDGHATRAAIERPFFALDTERSYSFSLQDSDALARRYALGEEVDVYRHKQTTADAFIGFSRGLADGWSYRHGIGVRFDDARFSRFLAGPSATPPPEDRRLAYPYYRFEAIQDDFATTINRDVIGRTEDEAYGRRYLLELGLAARAFGSDRNAAIVRAEVSDGYRLDPAQSLFLRGDWSARLEDGQLTDSKFGAGARYFYRMSPHSTFYAGLNADFGTRLNGDHDLLLGGDNGLRAYPIAF